VPIHDQSYRRYGGRRENARGAWTVIAVAGITSLLKRRAFLGWLLFAWIPFIYRAVQIYVSANFPQFTMLAMKPESFRDFFDQQGIFVFFTTVYIGAGLIANDRRVNALQIYLSKPLSRAEYVAGKMAILVTFLLLVTLVPAMLLLLLQAVLAGSFAFLRENIFLVPAITLFSLVQVLAAGFSMLALSSLSNSSRFVAVLYAGLVLFTRAMFEAMRGITGTSRISWISFTASLEQVGDFVFKQRLRYETPVAVSFIVVLALIVVSVSVLERRVRGVEVVT
jgi:ABC-2 type transport system permease protein